MTRAPAGVAQAATLASTTMLIVAMGILTTPVLINLLGGVGFAAWAVLSAFAAAFTLCDVGVLGSLRTHLAVSLERARWQDVNGIIANTVACVLVSYGLSFLVLVAIVGRLASLLRLPDGAMLNAGQLILLVFVGVVLRSLLQIGVFVLYAGGRFFHVGMLSFLQAVLANGAAIWAAWRFGRLDVILVWFWGVQLVAAGTGLVVAAWRYPIRFAPGTWQVATMRRLFAHGARIQLGAISELVNFQFDKFVIASLVGLWAVGPYEVANRSALALRSIPVTGLESYLPRAAIGAAGGTGSWTGYLATTRLACVGALVFLIAPLTVAPVWLYAWTGQMGHFGRWAFALLAFAATCSVIASPAVSLAQASGQPRILSRAALVSVGLNVLLSLLMAHFWGLTGAAAGTGVAMSVSAFLVIFGVHRLYRRRLRDTLGEYRELWPMLAICLVLGAIVNIRFDWWIATLDPMVRYAYGSRIVPAIVALSVYLGCIGMMVLVGLARDLFTPEERALVVRVARFGRDRYASPGS